MSVDRAEAQESRTPMAILVIVAISLSVVIKVFAFGHPPLWLDEIWTGAIIDQPDLTSFFHQIYWDVNAPFYYLLTGAWRLAFGLSDVSLRAPSLIASLATPLVPLLLARSNGWFNTGKAPALDGLTDSVRLCWAGLLALWEPGLAYAQEARCYAVLLLICTIQAVAFLRLANAPTLRRALEWAGLSALAIFTHYHAVLLIGFEGLILIAARWRSTKTLWIAGLVFVPVGIWILFHMGRVLDFARPDAAWYPRLDVRDVPGIVGYMAAGGGLLGLTAALAAIIAVIGCQSGRAPKITLQITGPSMLVGASLLGAATVTVLGLVRPSFAIRYLTPFAPGFLLGLTILMGWLAQNRAAFGRLAILFMYIACGGLLVRQRLDRGTPLFSTEAASAAIAQSKPKRLLFLLDSPNSIILRDKQIEALGGFFFNREHVDIPVAPIVLRAGEDPNLRLAADAKPGDALIWMYDLTITGTHAKVFPPALAAYNPQLHCRQFAQRPWGAIACLDGVPLQGGAPL